MDEEEKDRKLDAKTKPKKVDAKKKPHERSKAKLKPPLTTGCPQVNPFLIDEVVKNIIGHVEQPDLANLRLVNLTWQKQAELQIRNSVAFDMVTKEMDWERVEKERDMFLGLVGVDKIQNPNLEVPEGEESSTRKSDKSEFEKRPLFKKFVVSNYAVLKSDLFVRIGPCMQAITVHAHEHFQQKVIKHLLLNCTNLEYLELNLWTTEKERRFNEASPDEDFLRRCQPLKFISKKHAMNLTEAKFFKLKTLIVKISAYYESLKTSHEDFFKQLLTRVPNLEKLLVTPKKENDQWAPGIVDQVVNYVPTLQRLTVLGIGFRLTDTNQIKTLLNNKFRLTELRLNEKWREVLSPVGRYQPGIKFLQLNIRGLEWEDIHDMNVRLRLDQADGHFEGTRSFLLQLIDALETNENNQFVFRVAQNEIGRLVAVYESFRSCATSAYYLRKTVKKYIQAQWAGYPPPLESQLLTRTVSCMDLSNVPGNPLVIEMLTRFKNLKKLMVVPTNGEAYKRMWETLHTVEELRVHMHPDLFPSPRLEAAITGIDSATFELFHQAEAGTCTKESSPRIPDHEDRVCVCNLQNLRKLEIENNYQADIAISPLTIMACFMECHLASLSFPYFGNQYWIDLLQQKSPALCLKVKYIGQANIPGSRNSRRNNFRGRGRGRSSSLGRGRGAPH